MHVVLVVALAAAEDHAAACSLAAQSSQGHEEAGRQLRVRSHQGMAYGTQVTAPYARDATVAALGTRTVRLYCKDRTVLSPTAPCKLPW